MDWPERYAETLARGVGAEGSLTPEEVQAVLRLAREVAHRTERVNAPVATYLAGRFVAERVRGGASMEEALREAAALAEELLPPPDAG